MGAELKWNTSAWNATAGVAERLASNKMAMAAGDQISDAFGNAYKSYSDNLQDNEKRKDAGSTANIIEQIRNGKVPDKTGLGYDGMAVTNAAEKYRRDELALGLQRATAGRAAAAEGRAAAKFSLQKAGKWNPDGSTPGGGGVEDTSFNNTLIKILNDDNAVTPATPTKEVAVNASTPLEKQIAVAQANIPIAEGGSNPVASTLSNDTTSMLMATANENEQIMPAVEPSLEGLSPEVLAMNANANAFPEGFSRDNAFPHTATLDNKYVENPPVISGQENLSAEPKVVPEPTDLVTPAVEKEYVPELVTKAQVTMDPFQKKIKSYQDKINKLRTVGITMKRGKGSGLNSSKLTAAINAMKTKINNVTNSKDYKQAESILNAQLKMDAEKAVNEVPKTWKQDLTTRSNEIYNNAALDKRFDSVELGADGSVDISKVNDAKKKYNKDIAGFEKVNQVKSGAIQTINKEVAAMKDKALKNGEEVPESWVETELMKKYNEAGLDLTSNRNLLLVQTGRDYIDQGLNRDRKYFRSDGFKLEALNNKMSKEDARQSFLLEEQMKYNPKSAEAKKIDRRITASVKRQKLLANRATYTGKKITQTQDIKKGVLEEKTRKFVTELGTSKEYEKIVNKRGTLGGKKRELRALAMSKAKEAGLKYDPKELESQISALSKSIPTDEEISEKTGFTKDGIAMRKKVVSEFGKTDFDRLNSEERDKVIQIISGVRAAKPNRSLEQIVLDLKTSDVYDARPWYTWNDSDDGKAWSKPELNWTRGNKVDIILDEINAKQEK